jgi:hypothetical protein
MLASLWPDPTSDAGSLRVVSAGWELASKDATLDELLGSISEILGLAEGDGEMSLSSIG